MKNYQDNIQHRAAFNTLAQKVFGISFEEWYQAGYWREKYIPYTLFDGNQAAANISVNIMNFNTFGEKQRYIQIGTVMTDERYRNQQLSRFLMEKILDEWNEQCNFIYLYANKSVLEMYPKFGFNKVKEYEYFKLIEKNDGHENCEKLNMEMQSNRDRLHDYAKNSIALGALSMQENSDLVMFYCASFLKENVYYVKSLDVIAVATFHDNQLHLLDVFGKTHVALDQIVYSLVNSEIDKVVLGFTPKDHSSYEIREMSGDDTLFIHNGRTKLFDDNKVMFPVLSHA